MAALAVWTLPLGARALPQPAPDAPSASLAPDAADPQTMALSKDTVERMTLPVMVDGQGPFPFVIDTASDRTVISRELAETLKLPKGPEVLLHGSAGVDRVQTAVIDHLSIGDRQVDHIEAPMLLADNLGAAGMLGVDSLRNLHIVMDFQAMRLSSSASRGEIQDRDTIVVTGMSRYGQLIFVDAAIRGTRVYVILDSGAQNSVGNPALRRLLGLDGPRSEAPPTTEVVSVTGRRTLAELETVRELRIGGLTVRNMPLAFAELHTFDRFGLSDRPALLLGMDVMSQCRRVSVDIRRKQATFTLN